MNTMENPLFIKRKVLILAQKLTLWVAVVWIRNKKYIIKYRLSSLPASMKIRLKMAEKSWRHLFSHYNCMVFLIAKGHVTLKPAVRFCWNENSVEILWWSALLASMKKSDEKWPKKVGDVLLFRSWAHKSWVTGLILTEFELDQDFMSVLVTCK